MNDKLIQIGLDSGMLNYVDNETPRHYFLSGHADEQDLQKFAELIVEECVAQCWTVSESESQGSVVSECAKRIRKHFGVEQ
jgi:hypothetical protein